MKLIIVLLGIMNLAALTNGEEDLIAADKRQTGEEDLIAEDKRQTGEEDLIAEDKRQTGDEDFIAMDKRYKYSKCYDTQSNGVGGTEVEIYGKARQSLTKCAIYCIWYQKKGWPRWKYYEINGMTYSPISTRCYCERNMTGRDKTNYYRSCFFE